MIKVIRDMLLKIVEDIDVGNSNLTNDECLEIAEHLAALSRGIEIFSKYQACKYLNVSRATFDKYVREGKIDPGHKRQGFKELFYYKKDLDKYLASIKDKE